MTFESVVERGVEVSGRGPMRSPLVPLFYWANVNTWVRPLIRLNISREVVGLENLPRRGPVILASNHCSEADQLF